MTKDEFNETGKRLSLYWNKTYSREQQVQIFKDVYYCSAKSFDMAISDLRKESPDYFPHPAKLINKIEMAHRSLQPRVFEEKIDPQKTAASDELASLVCQKMTGKISTDEFNKKVGELETPIQAAEFNFNN